MEQERSTQTIYFKDLCFAIAYKWKWLLIAALIGGILLGGIEMLTGNKDTTLNPISITPENQIKIEQLEQNLERTNALIDAHSKYLSESTLMALDPYHFYTSGVYICVNPTDLTQDISGSVLRGFYAHLTGAAVMDTLSAHFNMDVRYFRELISMSILDGNTLSITVRAATHEEGHAIAEAFLTAAQSFWSESADMAALCNTQFILFDNGLKAENSLFDTQNTAHQKLTTLKNNLVSMQTELNKLKPTQLTTGSSQPVLFALVGAVLGFCLVACFAFVGHLASSKVYSARMLKDRTGLGILGCLGVQKRNPIDRWLRKLEGRATDREVEAVAANIANRAKGKNLLLLGNCKDSDLTALTGQLDQLAVAYTLCPDPATSANTIHAIARCDAAVLVETCGKSVYDQVAQCKATLEEYEKPILGCVVVEG